MTDLNDATAQASSNPVPIVIVLATKKLISTISVGVKESKYIDGLSKLERGRGDITSLVTYIVWSSRRSPEMEGLFVMASCWLLCPAPDRRLRRKADCMAGAVQVLKETRDNIRDPLIFPSIGPYSLSVVTFPPLSNAPFPYADP